MTRFLLKRLRQGFLVVLGVTVAVFIATRMVGDPARVMLPLNATPEERTHFRDELGLNDPLPAQFSSYMQGLARGDFGESIWQRRPAIGVVIERIPRTFQLVFGGMALAVLLSIPLGLIAAIAAGRWVDKLTVFFSLLGLSIPQFWLGLMLIIFFGAQLGWLPTSGVGTWKHMILPMVVVALPAAGRMAMILRSSMIDELKQPYVRTARAKGLSRRRVIGTHALRNALTPVITLGAWELIRALAGYSVIVETVFAWPGLGYLAKQALDQHDLVLLQAVVLVVAVLVTVINVAVDVVYRAVDPRTRLV
ncbi:MAG: peptide/nickel transport system permease protein [Actinomycetota bacterium]|jgi:peptide/nickel transport system permease protein|nr:peptide/nickel transport system permease protein [Actinomycetota bacterium]